MSQANKMGPNRTGIDMSPVDSKAMIEGAVKLTDTTPPPQERIAEFREQAIRESGSLGSIPVPGTFKGALNVGKEKLQGHNPEVLINKLGQRLAFERAGVRLYDAMIRKYEASMDQVAIEVVPLPKLYQFRDEERDHALLVETVMSELGADPTAMTPDADASALAAMGLPKVIAEPRTNILQCLEAIQLAEFADNAAWENLQTLCMRMGLRDIAARFSKPIAQEKVHQEALTDWVAQLVLHKAEE